ncbi:hypothetical protein SDC9_205284 [bioreactor metagenome]|uniref:Uncharacterized protein n=1 Tax=bioreactor metagenome TaxID=1076179 RepID=A0A645J384_9ZZZZ
MTVIIIDSLEIININHNKSQVLLFPYRPVPFPIACVIKKAAVRQAGQFIQIGQPLQFLVQRFYFIQRSCRIPQFSEFSDIAKQYRNTNGLHNILHLDF